MQQRDASIASIVERDPATWSSTEAATVYGSLTRLLQEALTWPESRDSDTQAKLLGLLLTVAHVTGPIMGETYSWASAQPTLLSFARMGDQRLLLRYLHEHANELR